MTCILGPTEAKSGQSIQFRFEPECSSTTAIAWNLGDGTIVYDQAEILHRYTVTKSQIFTVTLITSNGNHTLDVLITP